MLKLPETSPSGRGAPLETSTSSKIKVRLLSPQFTGKFSIACPLLVSQMGGKKTVWQAYIDKMTEGQPAAFQARILYTHA